MNSANLPLDPFIMACQRAIIETQSQAYLVGGCVRDQILNRNCTDVDVVVEGDGITFANVVAQHLENKPKVSFFKNFGTAHFRWRGIDYEFVGARKESYERNSRKPIVQNGTIAEDIARRDFTINSIAISLHPDTFGQYLDLFNGRQAIHQKVIQTPLDPDITYSDDPLRMLRAIRFACQLDFKIATDSIDAIIRNSDRIQIISAERIHTEFNKILMTQKPSMGIDLLYHTGLLQYILPELILLRGVEEYMGKGHKDNYYHTLQVLDNIAKHTQNLWLRWAALLHDIAKPQTKAFSATNGWSFHGHEVVGARMAEKIFKRLKLPLDHPLEYVKKIITLHLRPIVLTKETITDSAVRRLVYDAGNDIDDLITLCQCDITSKNEKKVALYIENLLKLKSKILEVESRDRIKNFQPPISGELIMSTFGIKPSREIGVIKSQIKDAILDGLIPNEFSHAYQLMLKIGQDLGLKSIESVS